MSMTIQEIRDSGLLELYAIGDLSVNDRAAVAQALKDFPVLKQDLFEIEQALQFYGKIHGITPPSNTLDNILKEIKDNPAKPAEPNSAVETANSKPNSGSAWSNWLLAGLIAVLAITAGTSWNNGRNAKKELIALQQDCDKLQQAHDTKIAVYAAANDYDNDIVKIGATEKYPDTKIVLYTNPEKNRNILQLDNLPQITADQSFQLWSLKDGQDPIPLDVFDVSNNKLIQVTLEENTNAYAITIEPKGGSQSPNLADLIGVFSLEG